MARKKKSGKDEISKEERMFMAWADEARDHGLITSWEYQKPTFRLLEAQTIPELVRMKTKEKMVDRHLHRELTYTPDFTLRFTPAGVEALSPFLGVAVLTRHFKRTATLHVDTKGGFTVQHSESRVFSTMQKLTYHFHGVWPCKIVPWVSQSKKRVSCLFIDTWCPDKYRWKSNRKVSELTVAGELCRTVDKFMEQEMKFDL